MAVLITRRDPRAGETVEEKKILKKIDTERNGEIRKKK